MRQFVAAASVLLVVGISPMVAVVPAGADAGDAPRHAHTSLRLQKDGQLEVVSTGRAPAGARVRVQDRYDRHQRWATVGTVTAGKAGRYRVVTTTGQTALLPSYRACVVRPGRDSCTTGAGASIRQRSGSVNLVEFPSLLESNGYWSMAEAAGAVSPWLRTSSLAFQVRREPSAPWETVATRPVYGWPLFQVDATTGAFEGSLPALDIGGPDVQVRVVASGDRFVAPAVSEPRTVTALRHFDLTDLTLVTGTPLVQSVSYEGIGGARYYREAFTPEGGPVTVDLRGLCVSYDAVAFTSGGGSAPVESGTVSVDGMPVWSSADSSHFIHVDLAGRHRLTVDAPVPGSGNRTWFGWSGDDDDPSKWAGGYLRCAF